MLLPVPVPVFLALLGLGHAASVPARDLADASELPAELPAAFKAFPVVDAPALSATEAKVDLSDHASLDEFERQWLETLERAPTAALLPCPASCSSAGPDLAGWDLYLTVERMAVCNETLLFNIAVHADSAPTAVRAW